MPDDATRPERSDGALDLERSLVSRAQSGDTAALGQLLGQYGPILYRSLLLPRLGSDAAAKDALSETYAKVVQGIGKFTWQNVGFYPWLRTVALRVALDQLRARKKTVLFEADDLAREIDKTQNETPLDARLAAHRDKERAKRKVEAALETIHPRYARAIRLRILEERDREEVSALLEVTPATFDVLLHRALKALKNAIQSEEDEDGPA